MVSSARYIFFQRCINHIYVHLSLSLAFTQLLEAKKNLMKTRAILRIRYIISKIRYANHQWIKGAESFLDMIYKTCLLQPITAMPQKIKEKV